MPTIIFDFILYKMHYYFHRNYDQCNCVIMYKNKSSAPVFPLQLYSVDYRSALIAIYNSNFEIQEFFSNIR